VHAFALGRFFLPMIQPELPLVRQRDVEARRGPSWPAFVEPLISGSVRIERYFVAGLDKAMSRPLCAWLQR
jgi:hypothetical protein